MVKNMPASAGDMASIAGLGRFLWRRPWQPTPVFLPGESYGQRSLVGYGPQGCKELDTTERMCARTHAHTHTHTHTYSLYTWHYCFHIQQCNIKTIL